MGYKMVLKDMPVQENINMENNRSGPQNAYGPSSPLTATPPTTTRPIAPPPSFTTRRSCVLSLTAVILIGACFVCTLIAVSFIIYNFATCEQLMPGADEHIVCTTVPVKQRTQTNDPNANVDGDSNDGGEQIGPDGKPLRLKYAKDVRLPRSVRPLTYNISLLPYLMEGNFTFDGDVKINVIVSEDCYNITMHANGLNISKNDVTVRRVTVIDEQRKRQANEVDDALRIRKQYLDEGKQFFIIEFYDKLLLGAKYEINIRFSGLIQDYLQGFYRSSYQAGNETRWLSSTQFQATDARRAFPCFDEPALKANFTLSIARPHNMTTISNMPIVDTKQHETLAGYVWDNFAESLPMSTYLVAFAISDFSHLSDGNFSVWARSDAIQSASFALSVGPRILKFLEEYFDVAFPLPKIDMIALPDFQAGAMENWGLITYRETTMLYEAGVSSPTNKPRVAAVVGHELAHQWFGNLVTPSWWSDIWLNEGFASYMEYITVDAIVPEWKTQDQFVVNELQNVFQLDALSTSHRVSEEVFNPDEITEIFDRISYGKGCTIIRMMSHFLTSKVFRRGLSKYLKEMAYNSAEQDDLWRFLTAEATASGLLDKSITVKEIMDTWTLQVGFPVVRVYRHPHSHVIRLEQSRFLFDNTNGSSDQSLWWIPITFTTSNELNFRNTRPLTWIPRTKVYEFDNRNLSTAPWFIFNIQQTGYYRVNYDPDNWNAITEHLMSTEHYSEIAPANRAQLIDDVMNLAQASYLTYDVALNLSRYLINEEDNVPWKAAITAFNFIDSMFVNQGDYDLLKNYLLTLITNAYNDVGFDDRHPGDREDMPRIYKRVEILNLACHLGHRDCISESTRHFQNWIQVPNPDANNPISPNLRAIVYCTAVQYGTDFEWDFAYERYLRSTVSTEKEILLSALGCSREPWILFRYLRRSIAGDNIRKQDVHRVFAAVSSNAIGQQIAFDFIRNNWDEINVYLGSSKSNMNLILKFVTKRMNTKFLLSEFESFVENHIKDSGRSIKQFIEQIKVNVDWVERNYKTIVEWLAREAQSSIKE